MKFSAVLSLGLASVATAKYVKSLTEYTKEIPQCAVDAMKEGMKNNDCKLNNIDASDFDCICDNYLAIDGRVFNDVEHDCAAGK